MVELNQIDAGFAQSHSNKSQTDQTVTPAGNKHKSLH